jgi:hypothetical protein
MTLPAGQPQAGSELRTILVTFRGKIGNHAACELSAWTSGPLATNQVTVAGKWAAQHRLDRLSTGCTILVTLSANTDDLSHGDRTNAVTF